MEFDRAVTLNGSGGCCCWSPNGRYLAVVSSKSRLVLRDAASLEVLRTEVLVAGIDSDAAVDCIAFSPDSQFILASLFKAGTTLVFRVATDKDSCTWRAKITEGSAAGLIDIRWSPDSRHILSLAEFNVKLTVWSLTQRRVRYIKFPKGKECVAFSSDYLCVVERRDNRDCISLFSVEDWAVARHFELVSGSDAYGVQWSPKSNYICVYSGRLECMANVYSVDGRCLFSFKPAEIGLSLCAVSWSPCGSLLAIASTRTVHLFNTLTWSTSAIHEFCTESFLDNKEGHVYVEKAVLPLNSQDMDARIAREWTTRPGHVDDTDYQCVNVRPVQLVEQQHVVKRYSIVDMKFSHDSRHLYVRCNTCQANNVCWVWDVQKVCLDSVLVHKSAICCVAWSPKAEAVTSLMILTVDGLLHVWTHQGALCLRLPPLDRDYGLVYDVQWNPRGRAIAMSAKQGVVCCRVGT